ncbi:MAG: hypothetical protein J2P27_04160 [Actinobacteria bacterium]|nr:hypothetical protein [Actinomycetota bacterium]
MRSERSAPVTVDDPLTSPSFPAVSAPDSRSYRSRRPASQPGDSGQYELPVPAESGTSHQFIEYSSAPLRGRTGRSGRGSRNGYPAQPAAELPEMQQPSAPAANPYGSYVSQPQGSFTEPAYEPADYPQRAASGLAAASYTGYSPRDQAASATWYGPPGTQQQYGQEADGYLPADGLGGTGASGASHGWNGSGSATTSYGGVDYRTISYDEPDNADDKSTLAGYDPSGRHAAPSPKLPKLGYSSEEYQGYSGYGASGI